MEQRAEELLAAEAAPTIWACVTPEQWARLLLVPGFAAEVDLPPPDVATGFLGPRPLGRVLIDRPDAFGQQQPLWLLFFEVNGIAEEGLRAIAHHFGGRLPSLPRIERIHPDPPERER